MLKDYATSTMRSTHWYADGTSGNDNNDGLTVSTPKKTLNAVFELLPDVINHESTVHLTGTFTDSASPRPRTLNEHLVIDGGSSLTLTGDSISGTADADSTTEYIEVTGAGWTVDTTAGYVLEFTDNNEKRRIQKNTTDRIYPTKKFDTSAANRPFRVVRSTTELQQQISFQYWGGVQPIVLQRLYFSGSGRLWCWRFFGSIVGTALTLNSSTFSIIRCCVAADFDAAYVDPDTYATSDDWRVGVSWVANTLYAGSIDSLEVGNCYFNKIYVDNTGLGDSTLAWFHGSRAKEAYFVGCSPVLDIAVSEPTATSGAFRHWQETSYNAPEFSGSPKSGLTLVNCQTSIGHIDCSDNTDHGIVLSGSTIAFIEETAGTCFGSGNGGAGVYAHSGSAVFLKAGAVPTVTGTAGEIAVSDPTSADATWSEIDGGIQLSSAQEATTVKEVL